MADLPKSPITPVDVTSHAMTSSLVTVALAAVKPLIDTAWQKTYEALSRSADRRATERAIRALTERVKDISSVKTLLSLEQPLLITDFYSQQHIESNDGSKVDAIAACLGAVPRVIVAGVAGQGKSILLRYLALTEIATKRLALFIELKNYQHSSNITGLIKKELRALGFAGDEEEVEYLLESGRVTLLLDAFDEIPPEHQLRARNEIEDVVRTYGSTRVVLSTRPSLEIEGSARFAVVRLAALSGSQVFEAMRRMCREADDADAIEQGIKDADESIIDVLTSPLMVALLVLHFRLSGEFPETIQAFYGDLFEVLFKRHDQTKGYKRIRISGAPEIALRELFGYVSFVSRKNNSVDGEKSMFLDWARAGQAFSGRAFDAEGALDDIIKGTNLILQDGSHCRYAHRSIQEFYAARFLMSQPEADVARFLGARITGWEEWAQVLEFMEVINPYLFYKHFLIPHVGVVLLQDKEQRVREGWKPSKRVLVKVFGSVMCTFEHDRIDGIWPVLTFGGYLFRKTDADLVNTLFAAGREIDFSRFPSSVVAHQNEAKKSARFKDAIAGMPDDSKVHSILASFVLGKVNRIFECYGFVDSRNGQQELFT